jgi:di/tricarboxylate transporter
MTIHILGLALLVVIFVIASFVPVNLGLLALVAAFVVGVGFGGLDADGVMDGFPGDLFVLLVGVTYLFGLAQQNGTLQRIVDASMRLVGNRVAAIPWLMFVLTAFVAAVGALSAAAVAIVSPIAMRVAAQYKLSPLLLGLMVIQGATAGSFSPLSPFGAITNDLLTSKNLTPVPGGLFLNSFLFNFALAAVVFCVFGGLALVRERRRVAEPTTLLAADGPGTAVQETAVETVGRVTTQQVLTMIGIVVLVVCGTVFGLDVGFTALAVGVLLTFVSPSSYTEVVNRVPWSAVLLVCGVITYVGVLKEVGTIDFLGKLITTGGSPLLVALAAAYIGGIISAFASTAGVLGASIPLAIPLLSTGALPVLGTVSAIGIASSVVDVSPLSTNGALLVANQRNMDSRIFFRKLLLWAIPVIALAPLLAWLVFVVL